MRLWLVPDGAGKRSGGGGEGSDLRIIVPFYMAETETSLGAMRAYRAGAGEALARDGRLARLFSGKVAVFPMRQLQ